MLLRCRRQEIKGNVFKKVDDDKLFLQAKIDALERFHLGICLLLVLTQTATHHNLSAEWWFDFCRDSLVIIAVEILADNVKHSFLSKFNDAGELHSTTHPSIHPCLAPTTSAPVIIITAAAHLQWAGPEKYRTYRHRLASDFLKGAPVFSRTWVTPLVQASVLLRGVLPVFSQMSWVKLAYTVPLVLLLVVALKIGTRWLLYALSRKILVKEGKID